MVLVVLVLTMAGCGNKSEITISVEGIGDYELNEIPTGLENCATTDDGITVTVKEDGEYEFGIEDENENEYYFTLKYKDKKAEVQTSDELTINLSIK